MQHRQQKILSSILAGTISHLVERPSLLCSGYDLIWWQDEPVEAGVSQLNAENTNCQFLVGRGGLIGFAKSKPLGNGQIINIDALVIVMIIAVFHKKLI